LRDKSRYLAIPGSSQRCANKSLRARNFSPVGAFGDADPNGPEEPPPFSPHIRAAALSDE